MHSGTRPTENLATALAAAGHGRRLIVIDQFEELFTGGAEDQEVTDFLAGLGDLDPEVTVMLGVRADFFARCLDHPVLAEALNQRSQVLGPMGEAELSDAITKPAHAAGLKLENGLPELIIAELLGLGGHDGSGTLPLLSHVMEATWQHRDGNRLTVAGYREVGGVAGSVAKTATDAWHELSPGARRAAEDLLLALVTVGQGTRDTRRQVPPGQLLTHAADPDAALEALETLAHARLITLDQDTATLTHEVVLDAWPHLRKLIDADREGLLIRQRTESDASEWDSGGRHRTLLYRGDRLRRARGEQRGLSGTGTEFVTAATRQRQRQLWLQSGLALTLVALLVAALTGYVNNTITSRERDQAFFASILSDADQLQGSDPTLAAELTALAANSKPSDPNVVSRLIASQTLPLATTFADPHGTVLFPTYLDHGLLATVGFDKVIRFWNTGTPGTVTQAGPDLAEQDEHVTSIAGRGSILVSGSTEQKVRIRDVTDPTHPALLATIDAGGPVDRVALSHDGTLLAVAHGRDVTLWNIHDVARPQQVPTRYPIDGQVYTMWFTSGDRALITGTIASVDIFSSFETATVWAVDPAQPTARSARIAQSPSELRLAHNADGSLLAIGDSTVQHQDSRPADSEITIERIDDPFNPAVVTAPFAIGAVGALMNMAMSPDGRTLAVLSPLGTTLWNLADLADPATLGAPLTGRAIVCPDQARRCTALARQLQFAPDSRSLTIGLEGGTIQQWSLPTSVLAGPASQIQPLAVSPDGRRLLTSGAGVDANVWDISDPADIKLFNTVTKPDYQASASPVVASPTISVDGKYIGLSMHGVMTLIDVSQQGKTRELHTFPDAISLAFLRDRQIMLVIYGGLSPRIELWDYTDPANPVRRGAPMFVQISQKLFTTGLNGVTTRDGHTGVLVSDKLQVYKLSDFSTKPAGSIDLGWNGTGRGLAVTPDAAYVAMGWDNGTLRVWNIKDPTHITPLGDPIPATGNTVSALDISADGKTMAVGGTDSTVRLWSFTDPRHPKPQGVSLTPQTSTTWQLAFHPTANYLFGAGDDGALRAWNLDPRAAVQRLCTLTHTTIADDLAAHYPDKQLPALCRS
ncbi:hypothetical protein ACFXHA_04155 [Nocardia sp. NPDC059240]|uniref:nSTAND1 domain-containing NTPase n=1 Tax=Nocardia sp. NPDC059240 TaxID=3346786 RepID=UPI0036918E28